MTKPQRASVPRVCVGCGHDFGLDGPLSGNADVHLRGDELVVTCGPACRAKLGMRERKCAVMGMEAIK